METLANEWPGATDICQSEASSPGLRHGAAWAGQAQASCGCLTFALRDYLLELEGLCEE